MSSPVKTGAVAARGKKTQDATDGYTLLELLVALILTSAIATMIGGIIAQLRPLKQIEEQYELQRQLDAVAEVIVRDVENALHLPLLDQDSDTRISMIGTADSIRFVAVVKTGFRQEGLREVAYRLVPKNGTMRLVRETSMRRYAGQQATEMVDLTDQLDGLELRYLNKREAGDLAWERTTPIAGALPTSVSVDLGLRTRLVTVQAGTANLHTQ